MENNNNVNKIKLLFIGATGSGKSSIKWRLYNDFYSDVKTDYLDTEYFEKDFSVQDKNVRVQMMEVEGKNRNNLQMCYATFRAAEAVMIVFDSTNPDALEDTIDWYSYFKSHAQEGVQVMLLLNKSESANQVDHNIKMIKEFADPLKIAVHQVSSKSNDGLIESLHELITNLLIHRKIIEPQPQPQLQPLPFRSKEKKQNCIIQ